MSRVVHFEIHADEPERAVKFYQSVLGWQFTNWGGPMEYYLIKTGPDDSPGIDGGMLKRQCPIDGQAVTSFVCTVCTDNLDALVTAVPENGGSVALPRMPVPGVGWLAYFKDTEGNIFGAMQSDPSAA